ncbi:peptidylprolyl isomerase PpiC [Vibrio splendidus]|uniref:peptidylprolyl isomerase PpiC n=1 Tax=Vibrio splendidus TaxID=29497 RepID=UPI0009788E27|nr:peptidylprolyl isomerase PpiC [Vibrio splendidus]
MSLFRFFGDDDWIVINRHQQIKSNKLRIIMARKAAALHILVKHKEQAEDIIKQLKKGAKFQTLAKKHSTCPSGKKGGDLGEFQKGQMVPQFDKVCFSGETLIPHLVKTKFGWHVVKVLYRT